jgi:hypothetical protein
MGELLKACARRRPRRRGFYQRYLLAIPARSPTPRAIGSPSSSGRRFTTTPPPKGPSRSRRSTFASSHRRIAGRDALAALVDRVDAGGTAVVLGRRGAAVVVGSVVIYAATRHGDNCRSPTCIDLR